MLLSWVFVLAPAFGEFIVVRALRGLRPLRALKHIPGMAALVSSMVTSLPKVASVLLLVSYVVLLFGLTGVQLFEGVLHYRCALDGIELDGFTACDPRCDGDGPACTPLRDCRSNPRELPRSSPRSSQAFNEPTIDIVRAC